jgi:hypothetical protein
LLQSNEYTTPVAQHFHFGVNTWQITSQVPVHKISTAPFPRVVIQTLVLTAFTPLPPVYFFMAVAGSSLSDQKKTPREGFPHRIFVWF